LPVLFKKFKIVQQKGILHFSGERNATVLFPSGWSTNKGNLLDCLMSFLVQIKNFTFVWFLATSLQLYFGQGTLHTWKLRWKLKVDISPYLAWEIRGQI